MSHRIAHQPSQHSPNFPSKASPRRSISPKPADKSTDHSNPLALKIFPHLSSSPQTFKKILKASESARSTDSHSQETTQRDLAPIGESPVRRSVKPYKVEKSGKMAKSLSTSCYFARPSVRQSERLRTNESKERQSARYSVLNETLTVRMSEEVTKKIEERDQVAELNKKMSQAALSFHGRRKEIEDQVVALEERIKMLQKEEKNVTRKIIKTHEKTEQTLENKRRKQLDLEAKLALNALRAAELRQRQEKVSTERRNSKVGVSQAVLKNQRAKVNTVLDVKLDNYKNKLIKEDINKKEGIKADALRKSVVNTHEKVKTNILGKEIGEMTRWTKKNISRIDSDSQKYEELSKKFEELAAKEQSMLNNLGKTYDLHKNKIQELETVFTMKVQPGVTDNIFLRKKSVGKF